MWYVRSAHFSGGKKTYGNNIPSVFDTSKSQKERQLVIRSVETDKETNTSMAEPVNIEESETHHPGKLQQPKQAP